MRGLTVLFCLLLIASLTFALADPSLSYCEKMGYKYKITKTSAGEKGVCVVNGTSYDSWAFFQGKVGTQYSYCVKKGYNIATQVSPGPTSMPYAVCVPKAVSANGTVKASSKPSNITMVTLMEKNGDGIFPSKLSASSVQIKPVSTTPKLTISSSSTLPSSFDWRNVNGSNWMTPVKHQGVCGSCWDFSAVGAVEAKFNIDNKNPKLLYDLAEQDLLSCGHVGNCQYGGLPADALEYIKNSGIVDEACNKYAPLVNACNRCSDWQNRTAKIRNYYYVSGGATEYKKALMSNGPLSVALDAIDIGYPYNTGHAVVLVGWNDAGKYWIIKNSWGTGWGDGGYGKVPYGKSLERYQYVYAVGPTVHPITPHYVPEFNPLGLVLVAAGGLAIVFWRHRNA